MSHCTKMSREERITILDGSFGYQLYKHVEADLDDDPLWSSKALITDPEAVVKTHMDFIEAGADIIETNTYQASILGFTKYLNIPKEEGIQLIEKAVELAKTAIARCEKMGYKKPLIAGSVGPYGAYLHDGSEYTGSYTDHVSEQELKEYHESRISTLVKAGVDLLAVETIPSKKEAIILVDILKNYPVKFWLAFCCKSDGLTTSNGDDFSSTAIDIYQSNPMQIVAVGVNCIAPHLVENLIKNINNNREEPIPLIVYANTGEGFDRQLGWDNKCEKLEDYIPTWLNLGVKIIGGCCRVYADSIRNIKEEVLKWEAKQYS